MFNRQQSAVTPVRGDERRPSEAFQLKSFSPITLHLVNFTDDEGRDVSALAVFVNGAWCALPGDGNFVGGLRRLPPMVQKRINAIAPSPTQVREQLGGKAAPATKTDIRVEEIPLGIGGAR